MSRLFYYKELMQDEYDTAHPDLKEKRKPIPLSMYGDVFYKFIETLSDKVDWIADGFITDPSITMLYATDGIGKSLIGIQCALELANGLPVFKSFHVDKQMKIIYVVAERSVKEPAKRIKRMMKDPDYKGLIKFDNFKITTEFQGKDLSDPKTSDVLLDILKQHSSDIGGADIVFFDPLYALVKGDLKDDQAINGVFDFFRKIGNEMQANVFFLHHENRGQRQQGGQGRSGQDYYGNKFISGLCTAVWHMVKDTSFKTVIAVEKDSESALIPKMILEYSPEFNTVRANVSSSPKSKVILINAFLKKYFDNQQEFSNKQFFDETGIHMHPGSERRIISDLIEEKRIVNLASKGKDGRYISKG